MKIKIFYLGSFLFGFIFFFFPPLLFSQTPSSSITLLTIDQTNVPIRIDGHLDDWPEVRMIVLNQKSQITMGQQFWKGEDDFNGRVFLTYDAQYLYISAIVLKTGKVVNSNPARSLWNGDCLELFLSTSPKPGLEGSHLGRGDYHIGLSPGTNCQNPQIYCFNRDEAIPGSRLVPRKTLTGYLMEAEIPLTYFEGLDLGMGKTARMDLALDKGGELSGYRILRLNYSRKGADGEDPSTWSPIQWVGKIEQAVPIVQNEDLYANMVQDGTKDETYAGVKNIKGIALDVDGKPLAGVRVTTWPKTQKVETDSNGVFQLSKVKIYDKTVFYGRLDGYAVSLAAWQSKAKAVTLRLSALPASLQPGFRQVSPFFFGYDLHGIDPSAFDSEVLSIGPLLKDLNPGLVRLIFKPIPNINEATKRLLLDEFVNYTRKLGAEPMISVPIDRDNPESAAQWVRYVNVEKGYKVRYWSIGNEPDMGVPGVENYTAYDYINDFRTLSNSMRREDPSIFIMGPEVASKYTEKENDWITPFVQYDGDIADGISVHHYACSEPVSLKADIANDLRDNSALVRTLQDKVSQNTDMDLPLLVTGERACATKWVYNGKTKDEEAKLEFEAALWEAVTKGSSLKEHLVMDVSSYGWGLVTVPWDKNQVFQPRPEYWALKLWGQMARGRLVPAQIQNPEMTVYATQDLDSRDLTLMILNKGESYWRPKTLLNGQESDLSVDAGLDQRYDFEIPAYSISVLKIKANGSDGEALVYTLKMAKAGKEPQASILKRW